MDTNTLSLSVQNQGLDNTLSVTTHNKVKNSSQPNIKQGWEYTNKIIKLSRNLMNTAARTCQLISKNTSLALKSTALHLKLFSAVNVPIAINSIPSQIQKIGNSIHWKDNEGALLAAFSVGLIIGDVFETITGLVNASLEVLSFKKVTWISTIGIPLALSLVGASLVSKSHRLYKLSIFHHEFHRDIIKKTQDMQLSSEGLRGIMTPFIEKHLGNDLVTETSLLKVTILERKTSCEVVSLLKKLANILKENTTLSEAQHAEILSHLTSIQKLLKTEKLLQPISIVASLISGVALSLFLYPPAAIAAFALLSISGAVEIGVKIKQDRSVAK